MWLFQMIWVLMSRNLNGGIKKIIIKTTSAYSFLCVLSLEKKIDIWIFVIPYPTPPFCPSLKRTPLQHYSLF